MSFYLRDLMRDERELFDERAAIIEFDGRMSRYDAEQMAYAEILKIREAKTLLENAGRKAA